MRPASITLVLLVARFAAAQPTTADEHQIEGERLYREGSYQEALAHFEEASRLDPGKPRYVYNAARCLHRAGRLEEAAAHYDRFLDLAPGDEAADKAREHRAALDKALAPPPPPPEPPELQSPPDVPEDKRTPAPVPAATEPAGAPPPHAEVTQAAPTAAPRRWTRIAGWSAVGLGVAATGVGVWFGRVAASRTSDLEDAVSERRDWSKTSGLDSEGERAETFQIAGLVVGGVSLAAGVVLLLLDVGEAPVTAGPGGASVRF